MLKIGKEREVFWDNYLVEDSMTTARPQLMHPVKKETVLWFDQMVDGQSISYPCIVKDESGYKLYYLAWPSNDSDLVKDDCNKCTIGAKLCLLESTDGRNWSRPNLGIIEFDGSFDNNIVMRAEDNMFVFYDTNPACDPKERYKAMGQGAGVCSDGVVRLGLWCHVSADGYHFRRSHLVTSCGAFDTLNTAHWNGSKYVAYIRNYHNIPQGDMKGAITPDGVEDYNDFSISGKYINEGIRDIRRMESDDFVHWSKPEQISFTDSFDYPLYTNVIAPNPIVPHMLVGFPTRYCERKKWTHNFDQLSGLANREKNMQKEGNRHGLALTDCIFMCSRDGVLWKRYHQAFMTPGYETPFNWVYGDCYPAYGFVDMGDENYSMYTIDHHREYYKPKPLNRWEIRKDGFACYLSDEKEEVLVTKPLIFEGNDLHLSFETSARGYIYVDILDEDGNILSPMKSFEVFGNTMDRRITFEDGSNFSAYANRPVRLRFTLLDAKLYSLYFD